MHVKEILQHEATSGYIHTSRISLSLQNRALLRRENERGCEWVCLARQGQEPCLVHVRQWNRAQRGKRAINKLFLFVGRACKQETIVLLD